MEHLRPKNENQGLIEFCHRGVDWLKFGLVLLIILYVLLSCCNIIGAFDFPWQLSEGNYILEHGHPAKSVFQNYGEISSHFENEYIFYEALIAGVNKYIGWLGLNIFFSLLCFLIYLPCLLAFIWSNKRFSLIDICPFLLAQFLINMRLEARPELIADSCYVAAGIMLVRYPGLSWTGPQTLAFGIIFFLWANAHGTFLLGGAMLGLWYGQLFLFHWRTILSMKDFNWMRPGLAALIGSAANPFGLYRFIQPFHLHGLLWGQATSLEMWPAASGIALLPLTWATAGILILITRARERKYYWMIAMLLLLQFMTFSSIRYIMFTGLTLLIISCEGLMHPRERFSPPIFAFFFAAARLGVYFVLIVAYLNANYSLFNNKMGMIRDYNRYIYPQNQIVTSSSFSWLQKHPGQNYYLLSNFAGGSWAQMPGINGIHALIDSGSHRYSDRTNQLYYYAFFSPETFRLVASKLNINSIIVSGNNIGWASVLNANSDWRLAQVRLDSQLYLRRNNQGVDSDRKLFSDWEGAVFHDTVTEPDKPAAASSEQILRGLNLRPDSDSLKMLMTASDTGWATDPQYSYIQDWLRGVPDQLITETIDDPSYAGDNSSMGARILLLLRLQRYQEAASISGKWHPNFFDLGYHDMEMLRAEAFLENGDAKTARKILDSFWPQPRYSLRWARLCEKVYADDPGAIPKDARLLNGLADQFQWQEDMIAILNQNIHSLSAR